MEWEPYYSFIGKSFQPSHRSLEQDSFPSQGVDVQGEHKAATNVLGHQGLALWKPQVKGWGGLLWCTKRSWDQKRRKKGVTSNNEGPCSESNLWELPCPSSSYFVQQAVGFPITVCAEGFDKTPEHIRQNCQNWQLFYLFWWSGGCGAKFGFGWWSKSFLGKADTRTFQP